MAGRRMASLASRYVGAGGGIHVVDPSPDYRLILEDISSLEKNLSLRGLQSNDLNQLRNRYLQWYSTFEKMKDDKSLKSEVRNTVDAFLDVLALPNRLGEVSDTEIQEKIPEGEETLKSLGKLRNVKGALSLTDTPVTILKRLREDLLSCFSHTHTVSPSFFARTAILEAMNYNENDYLSFSDGSDTETKTYLMGHSLCTLLTPFIRAQFNPNQQWPIELQSSGPSYYNVPSRLVDGRQREKHCIVSLCRNEEESMEWSKNIINSYKSYLIDTLGLQSVSSRLLSPRELSLCESSSTVISSDSFTLCRISHHGEYISRRLNLSLSDSSLIHISYAECDLSRLIALLFDPSTPKRVTDAGR